VLFAVLRSAARAVRPRSLILVPRSPATKIAGDQDQFLYDQDRFLYGKDRFFSKINDLDPIEEGS
jgi:hypothetical protein